MRLEATLKEIDRANGQEIEILLDAVLERKRILHPEQEIKCIPLPYENGRERIRILQNILEFEKACCLYTDGD